MRRPKAALVSALGWGLMAALIAYFCLFAFVSVLAAH